MAYKPTWKERREDARQHALPIIAGVIVLGVGGWAVWHQLAARNRSSEVRAVPREVAAAVATRKALAAEADVLEKIYQRALQSGAAEAEREAALSRVIVKLRELVNLPGVEAEQGVRLARLEAARGSSRVLAATARSVALEKEATAAQESGQAAASLEKLREALQLQREANANAASAELKDLRREQRLAQAVQSADAEPLHATVEAAMALGAEALTREDSAGALKAFGEARAAQMALNQRFPASRYADARAVGQIDADLESAKAVVLAAKSVAREREAEAAAKAGRAQEAAVALAAAAEFQRDLNAKFPRSRFVSTGRPDELAIRRDSVLSEAALAVAAALDREAAALLWKRQSVPAAEKISAASALLERAAAEHPRGRALESPLRPKLGYLALRRMELGALQELAYVQLVPLAGAVRLARAEVSQDFYTRVMSSNPSRQIGRALPVDSVSWHDAVEFCQRLSWILGASVRLPTEAEFRAALGEARGEVWSAETSGGRTHEGGKGPLSAGGFYDLAGNVAEWLQPVEKLGDNAPVAGGSYLDSSDALRRIPISPVNKGERARHIGFRIVVEPPAEQ